MTRGAKQKLARRSTAAYGASQPLFDALRNASECVDEQKANLSTARNLVQNLHVRVIGINAVDDPDRHQQYMDCAVKAWRSATQVYADVFEALANVTAAQPHEGKEERLGHTGFAIMAKTAAKAKSAADAFKLYEDIAKEQGPAVLPSCASVPAEVEMKDVDDDEESDEESDAEVRVQVKEERSNNMKVEPSRPGPSRNIAGRPLKRELQPDDTNQPQRMAQRTEQNIKSDAAQERKIKVEPGTEQPAVTNNVLNSTQKDEKGDRARERRKKKKQKRAARLKAEAEINDEIKAETKGGIKTESVATVVSGGRQVPGEEASKSVNGVSVNGSAVGRPTVTNGTNSTGVEYEDINGEVDNRIKVKEEQKEAAKKAKKRKRVSGDSFDDLANDGNDPASTKKKIKVGNEGSPQTHKRQGQDDLGVAEDEGQHNKKKKSKA